MQIDVKNNNTNILEYEFTLNDFAKNFFVQEINNDYYPFHYANLGTTPTDPETKIHYFDRGEQWVGSIFTNTVKDESTDHSVLRIVNIWSYGLPILHIAKKVDNPQEYKYITIDFDYFYNISNSTKSDNQNIFNNKINNKLCTSYFNMSHSKNIQYSDTVSYMMINSSMSLSGNSIQYPYRSTYIPYATANLNTGVNYFYPEHNILKDSLTIQGNKSKLLPLKYLSSYDLYIQLTPNNSELLLFLYSLKKALTYYPNNASSDPLGEHQNSLINDKYIYYKNSNTLIGMLDNQSCLYKNATYTAYTYGKGNYNNILDILNNKVMIYLSKEPIY